MLRTVKPVSAASSSMVNGCSASSGDPSGPTTWRGRSLTGTAYRVSTSHQTVSGAAATPSCRPPRASQVLQPVHVLPLGALPGLARALEDPGQPVEAWLGQKSRASAGTELAVPGRCVAVAVGPQRGLGVVDVQAADAAAADGLLAAVDHL